MLLPLLTIAATLLGSWIFTVIISGISNTGSAAQTFEIFFTFGFVSTVAVALLATGYRYLRTLTALYKTFVYRGQQPIPSKYALDNLKFCTASEIEA